MRSESATSGEYDLTWVDVDSFIQHVHAWFIDADLDFLWSKITICRNKFSLITSLSSSRSLEKWKLYSGCGLVWCQNT